jgi:radical SAM-linked protein
MDEVFPWDHLDFGILKKFLVRERKKTDMPAGKGETPDCRYGDCVACGIPGMPTDTRLTPKLDEESIRALWEGASARAQRRAARGAPGVLWSARVRFAKEGPARFLSHLETGTILARAFRMAEVPVAHTGGFSPHPRFHFGPPLPVGVSSDCELFDVELEAPWMEAFVERLNRVLPGGFSIVEGRGLSAASGTRRKSLGALATLGAYTADLGRLDAGRRTAIAGDLLAFESSPEWIVRKTRDGPVDPAMPRDWEGIYERLSTKPEDPKVRTVDLKRACVEVAWDEAAARLTMTLRIQDEQGQTANPARFLRGALGLSAEEVARCAVRRTSLLREDRAPVWPQAPSPSLVVADAR